MERRLEAVQETMMIPVAIKAKETLRSNARIKDNKAVEIIRKLKVDTDKYDKFMSHEGVVARTIMFDGALTDYLKKNPDAVCVNLGSGLDARFYRVDNGRILWCDIDLSDAMEVRKQFFKEEERVKQIAGSILESQWTRAIPKGRPIVFLIEGVLMYFTEEQVKQLFFILSSAFDEFTLLAELNSTIMINQERLHDTVKHTGAVFRWGLDHGKDLETMCSGLVMLQENSFNDVMKKWTFRGWLFGTLPKLRELNDRLAIYHYRKPGR